MANGNIEITPKELYAEIRDLKETVIPDLKQDMNTTRQLIKQYNGLREKVDDVDKRTIKIETIIKLTVAIPTILGAVIGFIYFIYWLLSHLKY